MITNTAVARPAGSGRLASSRLAVIVLFQLFPSHSLLILVSNRPRAPEPQSPRASGNSQGLSQLGARGGLLVPGRRFHRAAGDIAATKPLISPACRFPAIRGPADDQATYKVVLHASAEVTRDLGPSGADLSLSAGINTGLHTPHRRTASL